jgi:hypothetical protein
MWPSRPCYCGREVLQTRVLQVKLFCVDILVRDKGCDNNGKSFSSARPPSDGYPGDCWSNA